MFSTLSVSPYLPLKPPTPSTQSRFTKTLFLDASICNMHLKKREH